MPPNARVTWLEENTLNSEHTEATAPVDAAVSGGNLPLQCKIEDEQVVIRIGLNRLQWAAERCPKFHDAELRPEPPYERVVDKHELARDVVAAISREAEDGTTPPHLLLDDAIYHAFSRGSLGFEYDD